MYPIEQLQGVLNQLAGTSNLGAVAAANVWAGTTNTSVDLLGALNIKAGNGGDPANWRGLRAVCNQLAGLTQGVNDLDPLGALEHLAGNQTW